MVQVRVDGHLVRVQHAHVLCVVVGYAQQEMRSRSDCIEQPCSASAAAARSAAERNEMTQADRDTVLLSLFSTECADGGGQLADAQLGETPLDLQ